MEMTLERATLVQLPQIWEILQQAIAQRKADGSSQWQNGYPNESVIEGDIAAGSGYVFLSNKEVIAYIAIQKEHHSKIAFQDEYRAILKRYGQEYDERYVWD